MMTHKLARKRRRRRRWRPRRSVAGRRSSGGWPSMDTIGWSVLILIIVGAFPPASSQQPANSQNSTTSSTTGQQQQQQQQQQGLQSISNWLRLSHSAASQPQQHQRGAVIQNVASNNQQLSAPNNGVAIEITPPPSLFQYQPVGSRKPQYQHHHHQTVNSSPSSTHTLVATANHNAKLDLSTATHQQDDDSDQFNLFVSNICERDYMLIRVRTSRPFYGAIHTLNYRRKPRCSLEGDGALEFQLNISHALDSRDLNHCGVIKLRRQDGGEPNELLSVVLAVRIHRNVELSDDKFLVLNCTNRCRLSDCSSGPNVAARSQQLEHDEQQQQQRPIKQRQLEKEFDAEVATSQLDHQNSWWTRATKRAQARNTADQQAASCSVWRFPWLLTLLCCLAILLIGSAISNCIICMSARGRSVANGDHKPSSPETVAAERQPRRRTNDRLINYDNSDYHRAPADLAHLQQAAAPGRGARRSDHRHDHRHNHRSSRLEGAHRQGDEN